MDDCLFHDPTWPLVVAGLDMRLDWVRARRAVHRCQCEAGCDLPCYIPDSGADKLWRLGQSLVRLQQRRNGMVSPSSI